MAIKIGHIVKQSGVPASTIRYYVKEGLLPAPVKVNKKMAHYDDRCIDRIKAIQTLQEKRFPLAVIRNILRRVDTGISLAEAAALEDLVYGTPDDTPHPLVDGTTFLERTGLASGELTELERLGLLMPFSSEGGESLYDQEDILMGRQVFKRVLALDISPQEVEFYVTLGRQITEHEFALRKKVIQKTATPQENLKITADLTQIAHLSRGYILRRLFQRRVEEIIHKRQKNPSLPGGGRMEDK